MNLYMIIDNGNKVYKSIIFNILDFRDDIFVLYGCFNRFFFLSRLKKH